MAFISVTWVAALVRKLRRNQKTADWCVAEHLEQVDGMFEEVAMKLAADRGWEAEEWKAKSYDRWWIITAIEVQRT